MKNMPKQLAEKEKKLLEESDLWDARELGATEEYQKPAPEGASAALDRSLGLKMVSIRLPEKIIEALKSLAAAHTENYQPYVRRILVEHVKKNLNEKSHSRAR